MRSYQDLNNNIHSPTVEPLDEDWGDDDVFQSELEVKLSADFCTSHKLAEISITDCNESEAELVQLQLKSDEVDRQLTVLHEVVDRLLISRFRTKDPVEKFAYRNIASRLDLHGKLQWVAKRLKSTLNTSYQRIIEETIKEFEDVRRDISQLQIKHEAELKAVSQPHPILSQKLVLTKNFVSDS